MKNFITFIFCLAFLPIPAHAQQGCITTDLAGWTIHWGALLTPEGISSNGVVTGLEISRNLQDAQAIIVHLATTAPKVTVQVQQLGSGDLGYQTVSAPGGTLTFQNNRHSAGDFYIVVNMYGNTYPTTITAIEVCDIAPTPVSTLTPTATSTNTPIPSSTPTLISVVSDYVEWKFIWLPIICRVGR